MQCIQVTTIQRINFLLAQVFNRNILTGNKNSKNNFHYSDEKVGADELTCKLEIEIISEI